MDNGPNSNPAPDFVPAGVGCGIQLSFDANDNELKKNSVSGNGRGIQLDRGSTDNSVKTSKKLSTLNCPPPMSVTVTLPEEGEESLDGMLRRHLLTQRFDAAMAIAARLYEGRAFRSGEDAETVAPALLETWSVALARLGPAESERLLARREEVIKAFTELLHDQDFAAAVAPGIDDPESVRRRHAAVHDLLGQFVSA